MSPRAPHRFHIQDRVPDQPGTEIEASREESRHMLRVLRLRAGARVDVFDGEGRAFAAELMEGSGGVARLRVLGPLAEGDDAGDDDLAGLPPLRLAVAVIKRRGMELMIEKLSELGVETLQLLITARTVAAGGRESEQEPPERWERLALAAAKQCGRNRPLEIRPAIAIQAWLGAVAAETAARAAYADLNERSVSLGQWLREQPEGETEEANNAPAAPGTLWIAIGPEGGWTPDEARACAAAGVRPVTLGRLTLRAETAAIAAAAAVRLL